MDARDTLYDGWPQIPERDRLPLVWLMEGAALTDSFIRRANGIVRGATNRSPLGTLNEEREAIAYELTLPTWWHYCPVRSFRTSDKPKPPPITPKPLYIWLRR